MPRQTLLRSFPRGKSKTFKKRYIPFNVALANSTPTRLAAIKLSETGTVVAAKIACSGFNLGTIAAGIMEVRLFLYCTRFLDSQSPPNPVDTTGFAPYLEHEEVDTINGFYVGSLFLPGNNSSISTQIEKIMEKFRFRRKCERNSEVVLSAETIVRNGSATSVACYGALYLTIQL